MIYSKSEEKLKDKKKNSSELEYDQIDPELLAESLASQKETAEEDVYGEINLKSPETKILQEIQRFKEDREREVKEDNQFVPADDTRDDSSSDDNSDDDEPTVPIKYYGYQIPERILEKLNDNKSKLKLDNSEDWLKIWLARVMKLK